MVICMKILEEQYKQALIEIEEKIKTSKKDKHLLNQLKIDREYIKNYLYPKLSNKSRRTDFDLGITETKDEISDMIISNQLSFSPLSGVFFINKNDKKIEKLFNDFIEEDTFGLKKVYDKIILNNWLVRVKIEKKFLGVNTFIPSIKRNFIQINKNKKLYEVTSKIHELGHAKTNIESFKLPYIYKKNSFLESYSIFLELVFADYLKNKGKQKQGYELKFLIFQSIKDITEQLYEELGEYKSVCEDEVVFKYFFEKNYKTLKGFYLALYFYFLYQSSPKETLEMINNFIKEVKLLNDNEIIKKFNINKNYFNKNNAYKLYKQLKEEKIKVKQK